jgi:hypothetical protein
MLTTIFTVDAETDGLYGPVWAIGAHILGVSGISHKVFKGQLNSDVVTDPWVRSNIVPVVDLPRYDSRADLLNAFWVFWDDEYPWREAVADVGAPVEAGLFRAAVELDRERREWSGPYPLHEVATRLADAGVDPKVDRREFSGRLDLTPHDPADDALASGLCWFKAGQMLGLYGAEAGGSE